MTSRRKLPGSILGRQKSPLFPSSALKSLPAGSHAVVPKNMGHFAKASGETVIELYGEDPFKINYVNPADDPMEAKH